MEFIKGLVEFVFHIDKHLDIVIKGCGNWSYLLLFAVIFVETGLVVMPFLPGDSLLFMVGALAVAGTFKISWLFVILAGAAIIGDSVNYACGKALGEGMLKTGEHRFFKREHVERTHKFYEKHGGKTIILARFIPIIRTFAPFVAGIGEMSYGKFIVYNITGALLWVGIFLLGGYYFGNFKIVKDNFPFVIFAVIIISLLPIAVEAFRATFRRSV